MRLLMPHIQILHLCILVCVCVCVCVSVCMCVCVGCLISVQLEPHSALSIRTPEPIRQHSQKKKNMKKQKIPKAIYSNIINSHAQLKL